MRHRTAILAISFLMILTLAMAADLALAQAAPFHPGQALFGLQLAAEQSLSAINPNPPARAAFLIDLLQRRTADLESSIGTALEMPGFINAQKALTQAVEAMAAAPENSSNELRKNASAIITRLQGVLSVLTHAPKVDPANFDRLQKETALLRALLAEASLPLRGLLLALNQPIVQSAGHAEAPAADPTDLPPASASIDPRQVAFPPGSAGALHAFFALTGKHRLIACADCHTGESYAGLPKTCTECHQNDIPVNHYPGECSSCHSSDAWKPAKFDHLAASAADCQRCHLRNEPANHYPGQCSACHSTQAWKPATFNHVVAKAADCQGCHLKDSPANHYQGQCSACHSTNAWRPANFNHAAAKATDCQSCHLKNRPANHYQGQCSSCHSTQAWKPATFNHAAAKATDCQSCHLKNRPANHYQGQCSSCHSTQAWKPATFNHAAAGATDCQSCHLKNRPANHFQGQCSTCHSTNAWKPANFSHSFPLNHGGANGNCSTCHPSGGSGYTCFNCHNKAELDKKHAEKGINDYASRCMDCHANGKGN